MKGFSRRTIFAKQLALILVLNFTALAPNVNCSREPAWLTEIGALIDRINQDLEEAQRGLRPDASEEAAFAALERLELAVDRNGQETLRILKTYPEIQTQSKRAERKFREQFRKLSVNYKLTVGSVEHWRKSAAENKKIQLIIGKIGKKISETNMRTQSL
jgi:hypothetical protein